MSKKFYIMKNASTSFEEFIGTEDQFLNIKDFYGKRWELNGKIHREDGPAVIYSYGSECWYQYGNEHREDGPAIILYNGAYKIWYQDGLIHREDGPAVLLTEEMKYYIGWVDGEPWAEEEWYFHDLDLNTVFPLCNFESKYNNVE